MREKQHNEQMSYLGLDIGTSGCKAVIYEQDRTVLSSSFREYLLNTPHPDWSELDSGEVTASCFRVIRDAVKDSAGSAGWLRIDTLVCLIC